MPPSRSVRARLGRIRLISGRRKRKDRLATRVMPSLQWRSDFLLPALFLAAIGEAQWRRAPMR